MRDARSYIIARENHSTMTRRYLTMEAVASVGHIVQKRGGRGCIPLSEWLEIPSKARKVINKKYRVTIIDDACLIEKKG